VTAHVLELISAARDEPLDPTSETSLREHLVGCKACRAFARDVEIVDAAIRRPEPMPRVPAWDPYANSSQRAGGLALAFVAVVALLIAAVVAGAVIRQRQVPARPDLAPIGSSRDLDELRLGAGADAVIAVFGRPDRTSADGRQWIYESGDQRGIVLFFDGPPDRGGRVYRGTAVPGREGFVSCCGVLERWVRAHTDAGHHVVDILDVSASSLSAEGRGPARLLSATWRGQNGDEITVWEMFTWTTEPTYVTSVTVFKGAAVGGKMPTLGEVIDPLAIDPCEVIARAAPRAGYTAGGSVDIHGPGREFGGGAFICAYGRDASWADPHLVIVKRPVSATEAASLVATDTWVGSQGLQLPPGFGCRNWRSEGSIWVPGGLCLGPNVGGVGTFAAVAVSIEPYFFIVTAATEDQARRLAEATLGVLTARR
jgi:hypothetical protein